MLDFRLTSEIRGEMRLTMDATLANSFHRIGCMMTFVGLDCATGADFPAPRDARWLAI